MSEGIELQASIERFVSTKKKDGLVGQIVLNFHSNSSRAKDLVDLQNSIVSVIIEDSQRELDFDEEPQPNPDQAEMEFEGDETEHNEAELPESELFPEEFILNNLEEISKSYCADTLSRQSELSKPFEFEGIKFVCTGQAFDPGPTKRGSFDIYRIVPVDEYEGEVYELGSRTAEQSAQALDSEDGYYHGVMGKYYGRFWVLVGPPQLVKYELPTEEPKMLTEAPVDNNGQPEDDIEEAEYETVDEDETEPDSSTESGTDSEAEKEITNSNWDDDVPLPEPLETQDEPSDL